MKPTVSCSVFLTFTPNQDLAPGEIPANVGLDGHANSFGVTSFTRFRLPEVQLLDPARQSAARIDFDHIECPACGERFAPAKKHRP